MERRFDLQPVLELFVTLSEPSSASPQRSPSGVGEVRQWSPSSRRKRLGDFTAIFQYLEQRANDNSQSCCGKPQSSPSSSPPQLTSSEDTITPPSPRTPLPSPNPAKLLGIQKATKVSIFPDETLVETEVEVGGQVFKWTEKPSIQSTVAPHMQKAIIIRKLLVLFPSDVGSLLSPEIRPLLTPAPVDSFIHIFIDNSNILIGFVDAIKTKNGYSKFARVRAPAFSFPNLCLVLERGRTVVRKVLVGSTPITPVIADARALGYECNLLQKITKEAPSPTRKNNSGSSSGSDSKSRKRMNEKKGEQAVDEVLNMKILESLLDYPPSTVVLGSGDGALGEFSDGFFKTVERALYRGWKVELVSFTSNTNNSYLNKNFRNRWGDKFTLIPLEFFADELLG